MPESLLNYRFLGTTLSYDELLIALENIIIDKVASHSAVKTKITDTRAPMEIEHGRGVHAVQAVYKGKGAVCRNTSTMAKERKERIVQERGNGPRLEVKRRKRTTERWKR